VFNQKIYSVIKTPHHFKMSNKHILFQLRITHLYFAIHPKTKCEGIWYNISWMIKMHEIERCLKTYIWYKKFSKYQIKLKKQFIIMFVVLREPTMVGPSHLIKRNPTSEIDTTSSPKILRHKAYCSSRLNVAQYILLHPI